MRQRVLTGKEADVVAAYRDGATIDELAARYGVSIGPIRRILKEAEIPFRSVGNRRRWTTGDETRMAQLYAEGWTIEDLRQRFGGSNKTLHKVIVEQGVTLRRPGERV